MRNNIMGYESRLYIIEKDKDSNFGEVIATINMCKMNDNKFKNLFTRPIDFLAFHDDGNTRIDKDTYDEICTYAYLEEVLDWLEPYYKSEKATYGTYNMYRRLRPLYKLLKSFNNSNWRDIIVLHYGY